MLSRLQVSNYVLIDSLDISFPEGLVIITGQTGAGKSILLGALSLVLGGKSDAAVIAEGAERCVVEAQFDMDDADAELREIFEENDLDWNAGQIIIRRTVASTGRSRSFVNDQPVTLPVLSQLSGRLIDIHSQHQTLLLSDRRFQLGLLDRHAGNEEALAHCRACWNALSALRSELSSVEAQIASIERDRQYNEAQYGQLESAHLQEGELESLEEEQKRLANAEEIKSLLCECEGLACISSGDAEFSLVNSMKEIQRRLEKLSKFLPTTASLASRLESLRYETEDVLGEISGINSSVEASEERLREVDDRLSLLYSLLKKHACSDISGLIEIRDSLGSMLSDSSVLQFRRAEIEKEISAKEAELSMAADALHEARETAAKVLAAEIQESIRSLEMPLAVFDVAIEDAPLNADGRDSVAFRFSATGRGMVDVARCASGGELSRIMLALKDMMARLGNMPTMIFDEIDTGVSGSVADKMGSMICRMGARMQVFAITHLPQVAAKGNEHFLVSKAIAPEGRTISTIERLSDEQRVLELARMLSGSVLTDSAIANARDLLSR